MTRHSGYDVVVVGGGLSGIAAALFLADAGASVAVLEARRRLGGLTWSFERRGVSFDNGQHVYIRACTSYLDLLSRIGSRDLAREPAPLSVPVVRPGGRVATISRSSLPAPLHLAGALARYTHLPASRRAKIALTSLALRRLDSGDPALDKQSFGRWLEARGHDASDVEAVFDLFCKPAVNLPSSEASLQMAAKVFSEGLLGGAGGGAGAGDIGWSRVPLGALHGDAGAASLQGAGVRVSTGTVVTEIGTEIDRGRGDAWLEVSTEPAAEPSAPGPTGTRPAGAPGRAERVRARAVVVAVGPVEAEALLSGLLPPLVRPSALGTSAIVNVQAVFDRRVVPYEIAAGLGTMVEWVIDRTEASGLESGQCVSMSMSAADAYLEVPPQELVRQALRSLAELFPGTSRAKLRDAVVTKERSATFRAFPGSLAQRCTAQTSSPAVLVAGAWARTGWPATMEGAVRSGLTAAGAALAFLGGGTAGQVQDPAGDGPSPARARHGERHIQEAGLP
ncbi:MAG: hydroxysqualene dehydroxylase HpnE [Acidimicrobiales bacterium]